MTESARWTRRSLTNIDQRKEDHDEFTAIWAANTAAVDLLKFAKSRLNNFYNPNDPRVDLLAVALKGGKPGFGKIIKLIDELTATLKKEQKADYDTKEYCESEINKTEDAKNGLENDVSDLETPIEDSKESITTLKSEIEALDDGIRELDKEGADYTDQRKEDHDEFTAIFAANAAAVDLLKFAKHRLNKLYNPKLYKPPPTRELSEEDQIVLNMVGTLAPTEAPGGISGTGIGFVAAC